MIMVESFQGNIMALVKTGALSVVVNLLIYK